MGTVMHQLELPKLVRHLKGHPQFAFLPLVIDESTRINIWENFYVHIPPSIYHNNTAVARIVSHSSLNHETSLQTDAIFYVPTDRAGDRIPETETMHGAW
jgi:glutamate mutase epsilon subunit